MITCFSRPPSSALSALAVAALLAGCAAPAPAPASLADTAARTPSLSTLNRLIKEAGLDPMLKEGGPYTVFAPSDEAFKAVPARTMQELGQDKALLKAVLSHHLVAGKLTSAEVRNSKTKSVQGSELALARAGDYVTVEDALVVQADVPATNGVVHVIDRVLIPPKR